MPLLARALRRGCTGIPKITMMTHGAQRIDLPTGISQPVAAGMLEDVTRRLRDSNASALWLAVPESSGAHAAAAAAVGFVWHHAESGEAMMVKWLGAGKSPIPPYATHKVGVGGLVLNSRDELLVIRETRSVDGLSKGFGRGYKLPGGLADLGEGLGDAAAREVFEETGIRTEFAGIVGFREQHNTAFGRSDLYFVCDMRLCSDDGDGGCPAPVVVDADEIAWTGWMDIDAFIAETESPMNNIIGRIVRRNRKTRNHLANLTPIPLPVKAGGSRGGILYSDFDTGRSNVV